MEELKTSEMSCASFMYSASKLAKDMSKLGRKYEPRNST